jgi:hypothetical protein
LFVLIKIYEKQVHQVKDHHHHMVCLEADHHHHHLDFIMDLLLLALIHHLNIIINYLLLPLQHKKVFLFENTVYIINKKV